MQFADVRRLRYILSLVNKGVHKIICGIENFLLSKLVSERRIECSRLTFSNLFLFMHSMLAEKPFPASRMPLFRAELRFLAWVGVGRL